MTKARDKDEDVKITELMQRYNAALHAMQSGVARDLHNNPQYPEKHFKHLRVGVNSAMVEHSALVHLLFDKGIITRVEYFTALAEAMEAEKERYEEMLSAYHKVKVTLA